MLGVWFYLAKWRDEEDQRCRRRNVWCREVPAWAPSPSSYNNQRRRIPTSGYRSVIVTTLFAKHTHTRDAISTFKLGFFGPAAFPVFPVRCYAMTNFVLMIWKRERERERDQTKVFDIWDFVRRSSSGALLFLRQRVRPYIMERGCWTIQTMTRVAQTAALIVPRINEERKACDSDLIVVLVSFSCLATSSCWLTATSHVINDVKYGTLNYEFEKINIGK